MNKSAIKNYAVWARNELIDRVTRKAFEYGIEKDKKIEANIDSINGHILTSDEKRERIQLIGEIKQKGFDHVIEEVAYTWFNRFIALRFMEVNNYLPNKIRVFTDYNGDFKPQIIDEAMNLEFDDLSKESIYELIESNNKEELYKQLIISTCNDMGKYLPGMFTSITDYKVLLFPDNLLNQESVIGRLIRDIEEDSWFDAIDEDEASNGITVIGWLYQYYISERHDKVVNILKGNVKKEDIPAATQLWTTDWVVRYMVDNSLGRYWIERNPESPLKDKLKYLATSKKGELPVVEERVGPEEITFLDPCMGSGHVLAYAFDIFMEIYKECGYSERDAAINIVEKNLYGLDIDDRAYQLSYFAVMMKARYYNRRILTKNVSNNLAAMQESNDIDAFVCDGFTTDDSLNAIGEYLVKVFKDAKEIGSLMAVNENSYDEFDNYLEQLGKNDVVDLNAVIWKENILPCMNALNKQAKILSKKYTVCTTNPPYMGKMEGKLKSFVIENYKDYSSDLFAVFMKRNFDFTNSDGYLGFMTPFVWMFIKSYEKLRNYIIQNKGIATLVQMEYSAYEEATVPICSFVLKNKKDETLGYYYRLSDFKGGMSIQKEKVLEAQKNKECGYFYETYEDNFPKIPGSPVSYWASESAIANFKYKGLDAYANAVKGLDTCDNDRFVREWHEVKFEKIGFNVEKCANTYDNMWFPYCKGGGYRKWYGLYEKVVNWENDGTILRNLRNEHGKIKSRPQNTKYYFNKGITFSTITSSKLSMRLMENSIFGGGGSGIFSANNTELIGLLNSKTTDYYLNVLNPTLNFLVGDMLSIPIIEDTFNNYNVSQIVEHNIKASKSDWDSFETSWNFTVHPLVKNHAANITEAYMLWRDECEARFQKLKANEEELNRIFIEIYGLQDDLTPDVEEKAVTVYRVFDKKEDIPESMEKSKYTLTKSDVIKSFISYAVGCMFGRYSLDKGGLAYAGGDLEASKYKTFIPDADNIIPICDDEYFHDDIVGRFIEFVETVYGKDSLEENLDFIAKALGGNGTPREVIRKYFLNDFYKDHCKTYQKRPIYWLFDSGKKNGFKALIYMHRYQPDLIARMRTQYVFEQQSRYDNQITIMEKQLNEDLSSSERMRLKKNLKEIREQDIELRKYQETVHHYADMMIDIDLDNGVKVNYEKFKDLLAKVK